MALDAGVWSRRGDGTSGLRKLLKGWCFAINKYSEEMGGNDGAYIYNERANVSVLAAGAWLQGGIALEEYSSPKTKNNLPSNGRCDLYVYIAGENYEIEAKALTSRMPVRQDLFEKKVGNRLDQALTDAQRLPLTSGVMRVGCVFFILRLKAPKRSPTTTLIPQYERELKRYQKYLKQSENCDAFAWSLPPSARRLRTGGAMDDFAFGAIVAMKLSGKTSGAI